MSRGFLDSVTTLKNVVKILKTSDEVSQFISGPEQLLTVTFPVKMDDGSVKMFTGYRARYSTVLGPAKGGIRFHPRVTDKLIVKLSFEMAIKCAIAGLPFGGGKGGVVVDVAKLSSNELERLSRAYIRAIASDIGAHIDVPAPDMGTNATIISYMLDEYEKIFDQKEPAVITGKPVSLGGSVFRTEATGYGVHMITRFFCEKYNIDPKNTTVAVQGFGNLGSYTVEFLHKAGFKIVAITDAKGGFYNKNGLDVPELLEIIRKSKNKRLFLFDSQLEECFEGSRKIDNDEIISLNVDILIPGAIDGVITEDNAESVKAKYIIEGANLAITEGAEKILIEQNIEVLPDVLCNSGGVTVSYFEWVQNIENEQWDEEKVKKSLEVSMKKAFDTIYFMKNEYPEMTLRESAYAVALNSLVKEIKQRINELD